MARRVLLCLIGHAKWPLNVGWPVGSLTICYSMVALPLAIRYVKSVFDTSGPRFFSLLYFGTVYLNSSSNNIKEKPVPASERRRELKRRRQRKQKVAKLAKRAEKASVSEQQVIAHKLRGITPGAEELIERWELKVQ